MKNRRISIFLLILLSLITVSCTRTYVGRIIRYGRDYYNAQDKFPYRTITKADSPFFFGEDQDMSASASEKLKEISWLTYDETEKTDSLENMLEMNETRAFIIIKDDNIIYERYFEDCSRDTLFPSFSASKSITSAMIGIAVNEGLIESIDDPVQKYIPEFNRAGYEKIAIRNLLEMNSGFKHSYGLSPFSDLVISSAHTNITKLALKQKIIREPGASFEYNNYNTVLLGMILKEVSGVSPSVYLEQKLWRRIGTEYDAQWNLCGEDKMEYMASGINASIIDYAKFARLFLNYGDWDGASIISSAWIKSSTMTHPSENGDDDYYKSQLGDIVNKHFAENVYYYSRHWWGTQYPNRSTDYLAIGMFGQYFYVCPDKNMIIIRIGRDFGDIYWWPDIFRDITERF